MNICLSFSHFSHFSHQLLARDRVKNCLLLLLAGTGFRRCSPLAVFEKKWLQIYIKHVFYKKHAPPLSPNHPPRWRNIIGNKWNCIAPRNSDKWHCTHTMQETIRRRVAVECSNRIGNGLCVAWVEGNRAPEDDTGPFFARLARVEASRMFHL